MLVVWMETMGGKVDGLAIVEERIEGCDGWIFQEGGE